MEVRVGPSGPYYPIPVDPIYNPDVPSLQNTDRADARMVMNPWIMPFFENIHATKEQADLLQQRLDDLVLAEFVGPFDSLSEIPQPYKPKGMYIVGTESPWELHLVVDGALKHVGSTEIDFTHIYTKQEIADLLSNKAEAAHEHQPPDIIQNTNNRFVNDSQISLWNTVEDLPLKEDKANKGVADGYAELDENGVVPMSQISDAILGQMVHAGEFNATTAVATLTSAGKTFLEVSDATITLTNDTTPVTGFAANQGNFYITEAAGTFANIPFLFGDWLVANESGWAKINNSGEASQFEGGVW